MKSVGKKRELKYTHTSHKMHKLIRRHMYVCMYVCVHKHNIKV